MNPPTDLAQAALSHMIVLKLPRKRLNPIVLWALLLNLIAFSTVVTFGTTVDNLVYERLGAYSLLGLLIILLDVLLMMLSVTLVFSKTIRMSMNNRAPIILFYLIICTMCSQILLAVYTQWPIVSWTRELIVQGNVGVPGGACLAIVVNAVFGLKRCSDRVDGSPTTSG